MKIEELLEIYLGVIKNENKNLINVAFDEMNSSQYEEAAAHFDQLYVQDSTDYMSYFFRAYCKSHCGKRGDVYPDSQTLTSAFDLAWKKAIASQQNLGVNVSLLIKMYDDGMSNLSYNAVEETTIDSNGNSHTSNPDKVKIARNAKAKLYEVLERDVSIVKSDEQAKKSAAAYLFSIAQTNFKLYTPLVLEYDPSLATELNEKKKKAIIGKLIFAGIVIAVILLFSLSYKCA